jgi:hypothetical protein
MVKDTLQNFKHLRATKHSSPMDVTKGKAKKPTKHLFYGRSGEKVAGMGLRLNTFRHYGQ